MSVWADVHRSYTVVTHPAYEPMDVQDAKDHCRIDQQAEDVLIQALITAARQQVELDTERVLITTTFDLTLDTFPADAFLRVERSPLLTVTSVTSYDTSNTSSTYASSNYVVDTASEPGRVFLNSGSSWPSGTRDRNAGIVRFTAGYGETSDTIPEVLMQAMRLLIASWYEHREQLQITAPGEGMLQIPWGYPQLIAGWSLKDVG